MASHAPALAVLVLAFCAGTPAQDKGKSDKKNVPVVAMAVPLGGAPGTTAKHAIRGLKLTSATAIKFDNPQVSAKIVGKANVPVPDKNPDKVGDTQIEVEITLPKGLPGGALPFVVVTPDGEAKHALLIESELPLIQENEPNDGFRQAQPIKIPQAIDGRIERSKDVDVFRLEGK